MADIRALHVYEREVDTPLKELSAYTTINKLSHEHYQKTE
ncbi:unnamed protein product, partial [marine sediment metagenome]